MCKITLNFSLQNVTATCVLINHKRKRKTSAVLLQHTCWANDAASMAAAARLFDCEDPDAGPCVLLA